MYVCTYVRTYVCMYVRTVASMLLISPAWDLTVYLLQVKHVLTTFGLWMYSCSLFEQFCPPKFPFLLWLKLLVVAQLNPIAQQTAKWRSCRPCLRLSTNLGPRIAFWGPDLGHILVPVSGSIFGHRFGPLQLQTKSRAPKRGPKMESKTRTKIGPKSGPKMQSGAPNLRTRKKGRVEIIFIQRSAGRSYSIVQQTNNFNERRKGNLGGQNCTNREHEYIHRPNIVKTCFTCRRYTVKSHAWENQQHACYYGGYAHASPQNCLFWSPGFGA